MMEHQGKAVEGMTDQIVAASENDRCLELAREILHKGIGPDTRAFLIQYLSAANFENFRYRGPLRLLRGQLHTALLGLDEAGRKALLEELPSFRDANIEYTTDVFREVEVCTLSESDWQGMQGDSNEIKAKLSGMSESLLPQSKYSVTACFVKLLNPFNSMQEVINQKEWRRRVIISSIIEAMQEELNALPHNVTTQGSKGLYKG